jgi:hypothetical protein
MAIIPGLALEKWSSYKPLPKRISQGDKDTALVTPDYGVGMVYEILRVRHAPKKWEKQAVILSETKDLFIIEGTN